MYDFLSLSDQIARILIHMSMNPPYKLFVKPDSRKSQGLTYFELDTVAVVKLLPILGKPQKND